MKPVYTRRRADLDIQEAVDQYLTEAGAKLALSFVDALEQALLHIAAHPAAGSPRYAHELNLPGLRHGPVPGFPYLVFYMEGGAHIDVWRVLHGQRDIPEGMRGLD